MKEPRSPDPEKSTERPILIIDDDPFVVNSLEITLKSAGIKNIAPFTDPFKVIPWLEEHQAELIILDLNMPDYDGEILLENIKSQFPEIPVIVVSSTVHLDTAVRCLKKGAIDYLTKPVDRNRLVATLRHLLILNDLSRENENLRKHLLYHSQQNTDFFSEIITMDPNLGALFKYLESIALSRQAVLISGETGTGKELFAKAIHKASGRKGKFVAVNVAGVDDTSFSDTLFGHKRGAFTGADQPRPGLIKVAEGGTLYLDEIGDLAVSSQVKLLRLIQEQEYYPLGSDLAQPCEARIIASTNVNINKAISEGKFRKDLYYRLGTHQVSIPPLRSRRKDIPFLIEHFLAKSSKSLGKKIPKMGKGALEILESYPYPGNVRELEAIIHDMVASNETGTIRAESVLKRFAKEELLTEHLENNSLAPPEQVSFSLSFSQFPTLREIEDLLIKKAMEMADSNQSLASKLLGISRQTLNTKLRALSLGKHER